MLPSWKTAVKMLMVFLLPAISEAQVFNVRDKIIFPVVPNSVDGAKNSVCAYESELYTSHLDNLTLWAYESKFSIYTSSPDSYICQLHSVLCISYVTMKFT